MGKRDLTTASMVAISNAWTDPERERPLFAKYKRLAPWLEDVEAAHARLHEAQTSTKAAPPELIAINERAALLDAIHDRKVQGLHELLSALAKLSEDANQASEFITLRDELLPSGRAIVNRSYLDQAGEASFIDSRLSKRSKELLRDVTVDCIPLGKHVEDWKRSAAELGEVEAVRVRMAKEAKEVSIASLGKARNEWIAAVNAVVFAVDREKGMTVEDRRRLLEPLETALAKAARKKAAAAAKGGEEGGDATE